MFKWLREFFVGKDNVQPTTVEPSKTEVSQTITVEPPKLEVVPQTVETKPDKEPWNQFPKSPPETQKRSRKPRVAKPKPTLKKNANV